MKNKINLGIIGKNFGYNVLYKAFLKNNDLDFRIKPTYNNSKKFSSWILKNKVKNPNFYDGQRVHLIINKMLLSSKIKKNYILNRINLLH